MPGPASYTEASLAQYMLTTLGNVGAALGWTAQTLLLSEAVYEVELAYGVADIANAAGIGSPPTQPDIPKIRAYARREAWKAARSALADRFDTTLLGPQSFKRSQLYLQAEQEYARAAADAANFGGDGTNTIEVSSVKFLPNPYLPLTTNGEFG